MRLSLVDLSVVPPSGDRHQAIRNTIDMAQHAEQWGYSRIWLAEHHGAASMAGRTPESLIPLVAASTQSIRVGSGSVLLNHYSPYKVAEVFASLEDMFPGRIDMGIGRATTGPLTDIALQRNRSYLQTSDDSAEQLEELCMWMNGDYAADHPFRSIKVSNNGTVPPLWLLGSSRWSAMAAARLGLRYAFAGFINPAQSFEIASIYRQHFAASERMTGIQKPEVILSLSVYCADTEEAAASMTAPVRVMMQRMSKGDISGLLPDEASALSALGGIPESEPLLDPTQPPRILAGTPEKLKGWLEAIAAAYGADELMIQCITPDHAKRLRSHELLAQCFGLAATTRHTIS
jgi:luciferase family oxidoreductase group 1